MKLWLTAPYDPDGIEEIETTWGPDDNGHFAYNGGHTVSHGWYVDGYSFHRTREAAVIKAREHRENWIKETTEKAAKIAMLPSIAA